MNDSDDKHINTIGTYIGTAFDSNAVDGFVNMFNLGKYVQTWADLLEVDVWDILKLPLLDNEGSDKKRIAKAIKIHYAELILSKNVMSKILGHMGDI